MYLYNSQHLIEATINMHTEKTMVRQALHRMLTSLNELYLFVCFGSNTCFISDLQSNKYLRSVSQDAHYRVRLILQCTHINYSTFSSLVKIIFMIFYESFCLLKCEINHIYCGSI